jgi:hydroxyacylglutathione hydrolase
MLQLHRIVTGRWKENCYIAAVDRDAVVVDPGGEFEQIRAYVGRESLRVHAVINTHAHYDHLGAVAATVAEYGVPFLLHPADVDLLKRANFYRTLFLGVDPIVVPTVDGDLADGETLVFGALAIDVVHTPGHTPGSVCFAIEGALLTGDTIMAEHLGRTDLPGADRSALLGSIDRLAGRFAGETPIHPGHGPAAVLGEVLPRVLALPELR